MSLGCRRPPPDNRGVGPDVSESVPPAPYTVAEAADLLRTTTWTVAAMVRDGRLPGFRACAGSEFRPEPCSRCSRDATMLMMSNPTGKHRPKRSHHGSGSVFRRTDRWRARPWVAVVPYLDERGRRREMWSGWSGWM